MNLDHRCWYNVPCFLFVSFCVFWGVFVGFVLFGVFFVGFFFGGVFCFVFVVVILGFFLNLF